MVFCFDCHLVTTLSLHFTGIFHPDAHPLVPCDLEIFFSLFFVPDFAREFSSHGHFYRQPRTLILFHVFKWVFLIHLYPIDFSLSLYCRMFLTVCSLDSENRVNNVPCKLKSHSTHWTMLLRTLSTNILSSKALDINRMSIQNFFQRHFTFTWSTFTVIFTC